MILILALAPQVQAEYSPMYISIDGPIVMGKGETKMYRVDVAGGPSEGKGNYTYTASILGTTGADAHVLPSDGTSSGTFFLNVTAKGEVPRIVLWVNVTSFFGIEEERMVKEYGIEVMDPIVISANVVNNGNISVRGVPLTVFADGKSIYSTTVSLDPGASTTIRYNWTDPSVSSGEHVIKLMLDPDQEFITFIGGGTVYTSTIWVGEQDWGLWNILFVVLAIFLAFMAYTFYRRPSKRRKR
ncbi:MAG: hypothetical protein GKC03_04030 [Methanomassiliicoccales archaeon]|nr:hypothetical protein [Methanomassiliicoccales archaeon]NYT15074.1 hypothetical protein [Methanomassiliicoccales archaeon]